VSSRKTNVGAAYCRLPCLRPEDAFDKAQAPAGGYKPPLQVTPQRSKGVVVCFVGAVFNRPLCFWFAGVFCKA